MSRKSITEIPNAHLSVKYKKSEKPTAVYLSYFVEGRTIAISTKVKVYPTDWDEVKLCVRTSDKDHVRKNNILTGMVLDTDRRIKEAFEEEQYISAQDVRRILKGDDVKRLRRSAASDFIAYAHETNDLHYSDEKVGYTKWYNNKLNINKFSEFLKVQFGIDILKVSQMNADYVIHYIKWRQEVLNNKSREGINKALTPLVQAAERAANNDLISNRVAAAIRNTYLQSKSRQYTGEDEEDDNIKCLNEKQLQDFVDHYDKVRVTTQRYMDLFLFSIHSCGLRISDIITLEWKHIDFTNRKIKKNLVKFNKPHEVYITDSALLILNKYRKKKTDRFVFGLLPDDFNLLDPDAFLKKRNSVNRTIQNSLIAVGHQIGLDFNLTMHIARHTFAVLALKQGVSLHMISVLMGHSSAVVTEKRYAKFLPEDKDDVVKTKLSFPYMPY